MIREQVVCIVNVSAYGLGVHTDRQLSVGAPVKVFAADYTFTGTVVHCRNDGEGFISGIALSCDTDPADRLLLGAHRHQQPVSLLKG